MMNTQVGGASVVNNTSVTPAYLLGLPSYPGQLTSKA